MAVYDVEAASCEGEIQVRPDADGHADPVPGRERERRPQSDEPLELRRLACEPSERPAAGREVARPRRGREDA